MTGGLIFRPPETVPIDMDCVPPGLWLLLLDYRNDEGDGDVCRKDSSVRTKSTLLMTRKSISMMRCLNDDKECIGDEGKCIADEVS